jgi:hypothetical protein
MLMQDFNRCRMSVLVVEGMLNCCLTHQHELQQKQFSLQKIFLSLESFLPVHICKGTFFHWEAFIPSEDSYLYMGILFLARGFLLKLEYLTILMILCR